MSASYSLMYLVSLTALTPCPRPFTKSGDHQLHVPSELASPTSRGVIGRNMYLRMALSTKAPLHSFLRYVVRSDVTCSYDGLHCTANIAASTGGVYIYFPSQQRADRHEAYLLCIASCDGQFSVEERHVHLMADIAVVCNEQFRKLDQIG